MLKLRTILLRKELYYWILIVVSIITIIRINWKESFPIKDSYTGNVSSYTMDGNKLKVVVKRVQGTYYMKTKEEWKKLKKLKIGDSITIKGKFSLPDKSYQNLLKAKNIDLTGSISVIRIHHSNPFYFLKNFIRNRLNQNPYLYTFLLGDKSLLSSDVIHSYQENGISHLFAISGMHISLLSGIILKIFHKVSEEKRYRITSIFLIGYLFLVGPSPSILRGVLFFLLFSINKINYFYIKSTHLFIVALSITLLYNPYYLFDPGFQYSFTISLSLLLNSKFISEKNYFIGLWKTSLISFLSSIPISLYHSYSINLLSILYNLFFVPFISYLVFPLSLICLIIPPFESVLNPLTFLLEKISLFLEPIRNLQFVFKKCNIIIYFIYGLLLLLTYTKKKTYLVIFFLILLLHFLIPYLSTESSLYMLDVGQGDSILLTSGKHSVLIDTGGVQNHDYEEWRKKKNTYSIAVKKIIPFLKSLGYKKLDTLILTHGDFDHMGEVINLVNNFKVEKVIFNCGEFNDLENELIKVLDNKKIPYYSCIKELNIEDNKLYFLNNKDYGNENDNSSVIYTKLNNHKFLFMGDAGVEVEEDLIKKYNLKNIDVLKVGHHGSKTSSSKNFVDNINPKYSIISVGKNNRFGHPNREVLYNLKDSKIYRTDQDGSVMFKIKNNKLNIETCSP